MGEMADWLTSQDPYDDQWEDDQDDLIETQRLLTSGNSLIDEPVIWTDHTGTAWRLSRMETSHLIFINRLVVNQWALALGLRPVPIKNPVAILDPERTPEQVIDVARRARVMAEEVMRRVNEGERLDGGVGVVWERVVNKYQECLRRAGQPLHQGLLKMANNQAMLTQ